jgi:ABC-type phosphate/phosphonate transport system substrate-binding protein
MSVAELEGMQPVISNPQSLSGWCSLGYVLAEVTTTPSFVKPYIAAERHTGSLQLLQDGKADFASIDPGTFQLLQRHRPSLTQGLRIIGRGPLVPATPIHLSKLRKASLSEMKTAMSEIFAREELRHALAEIGMSGFAPMQNEDYAMIGALVQRAESVLPRR